MLPPEYKKKVTISCYLWVWLHITVSKIDCSAFRIVKIVQNYGQALRMRLTPVKVKNSCIYAWNPAFLIVFPVGHSKCLSVIHSKCSVRTPKFLRICPARFPKPHSKFQSVTIYIYLHCIILMCSTWYLSALYFPTPLPASLTSSPLLASPCAAVVIWSLSGFFWSNWMLDPPSKNTATHNGPRILQVSSFGSAGRCLDTSKCSQLATKRIAPHHRSMSNMHLGRLRWWKVCLSLAPDWGIHPPFAEIIKNKLTREVENHPAMYSLLHPCWLQISPEVDPLPALFHLTTGGRSTPGRSTYWRGCATFVSVAGGFPTHARDVPLLFSWVSCATCYPCAPSLWCPSFTTYKQFKQPTFFLLGMNTFNSLETLSMQPVTAIRAMTTVVGGNRAPRIAWKNGKARSSSHHKIGKAAKRKGMCEIES